MIQYRLGQAARVLGVSVDTVRRYADRGRLESSRTPGGQRLSDGAHLAQLAESLEEDFDGETVSSARNHMLGIVTRVVRDTVMAQVEMRCGPFRMVSLLSREAADELELEPGVLVNSVVKATNVVVERATDPPGPAARRES